ncbi:hypothetical protein QFC24_005983 [Naganishia onofrii]|uniref:Uncharacterized protein n=1 Tax=Naganishia onofrii TaxID=1851511 RepID=A0ACC2X612_9TREE|nr:hypothetical protein QFC24_005983 [Naganishia onofrii]
MQQHWLGAKAQFCQVSLSNARSSPHISPKNPSPSVFEATGLPIQSANFYPPTWEAHPILPGPPKKPKEYRHSPFPSRDSWPIATDLPVPAAARGSEWEGRGWERRGPSRSVSSVFPGVDSWPTSPTLAATRATPPRHTSSRVSSPLALTPAATPPGPAVAPHSSLVASFVTPSRYTPSPLGCPRTLSAEPSPQKPARPLEDEDDHGDPWYSWMCFARRKAKREIRSTV